MISKKTQKLRKKYNKSGSSPCDICGTRTILETHHINGRKILNYNANHNLCSICPNCHNEIHWGKIIIEKWVMTTNGLELIWHKKDEENLTGERSNPPLIVNKKSD